MKQALTFRLTCTALVSDGRGLGRDQGRVVLCAGLVPGDVADVCVEDTSARLWEAQLVTLINPSSHRVTPSCEHAEDCGGCSWMNMDYETQALWKTQIVQDAFARIGGCESIPLLPFIAPQPLLQQRTKMEYAFANTKAGLRLGLRRRASHEIVSVTGCLQQSKACMEILATVRDVAKKSAFPAWDGVQKEGFWRYVVLRETSLGKRLLECIVGVYKGDMRETRKQAESMMQTLTTALRTLGGELPAIVFSVRADKSPVAYGERRLCSQGAITLVEQVGDLTLDMAHDAFFQVHRAGTKLLYDAIKETIASAPAISMASKTSPTISPDTTRPNVWDIYCGVGSIGLYVADAAHSMTGMDNVQAAINQATRNATAYATKHGLAAEKVHFVTGDAKQGLSALVKEQKKGRIPKADVMIFDPPRAGLSKRIVDDCLKFSVARLVLVSCNPSTLARDVGLLKEKFDLTSVQMVDMFPHTPHVECVAVLQRK